MDLPVMEKERQSPEQIAKDAMAKIEKSKQSEEAKKAADKANAEAAGTAESKDAAEAAKAAETKKIEEETKAKEDAAKKKADELKAAEPKGDKVAERKAEIQKEIDALVAQKKAAENELKEVSQAKAKIQQEIADAKKPKEAEDQSVVLKKAEQERIAKYAAEDAEKPREQRREMTKDAIDDWYLEDPASATEWIQERTLRRVDERKSDQQKVEVQGKASEFIARQEQSRAKLIAKFPQVQVSTRANELMASGKTAPEAHHILMEENEHYKLCHEIATSDPKYLESDTGPEMVMQEMEKRLSSKGGDNGKKSYTAEEVERIKAEAIGSERARLAGIDNGVRSTTRPGVTKPLNDFEKRQLEIAKKAGMTEEQLRKARERRAAIVGADNFNDEKNV